MHRIDGPGHINNTFSEGDPAQGIVATVVTDDWMNAVQEELVNAIEGLGVELDKGDNTQLMAALLAKFATQVAVDAAIAAVAVPAGTIAFFAATAPPSGYLKANGAAVSRATYAALFARIGTFYGVGDGLTTFNLPDLRGEFLRAWDDGRGVDEDRVFGSWQADAFKTHRHQLGYTNNSGDEGSYPGQAGFDPYANGNPASEGADETRPRNVALLACIKI